MKKLACLALVALSAFPIAATACTGADDEEELATSTATSALVTSEHGSMPDEVTMSATADRQLSAEALAIRIAARPFARLQPAGCATKTREGNTVHLIMKGCSTKRGRTMDGTMDAVFVDAAGGVAVTVRGGPDLVANGQPLAYVATATVRSTDTGNDIVWHAKASGTTRRGRAFTREADISVVTDAATRCATIDGTSRGTIAGRQIDTTISDLHACAEGCPSRGEVVSIVHTGPHERTMTVTFDGTPQARVKGLRGRMFNVSLACGDSEAE